MNFSFRKLFAISVFFLAAVIVAVATSASLLAKQYIEQNRKSFIEMTMASIEAGPLALARLHASDFAQKYLDRIINQINIDSKKIYKVEVFSKASDTFIFAKYNSKEIIEKKCLKNIQKEFTFADAISSYYISIDMDICEESNNISSVLNTIYITLFSIAFIVLLGFLIISYPVIVSLRIGTSVINSNDMFGSEKILNSIPFIPVRQMTYYSLRSKQQEREVVKLEIAKQVAHDIKSPLTALKCAIELFSIDTIKCKKLAESAFERVVGIIDDLNSVQASKVIYTKDIISVVEDSVQLKQIEYPGINIKLVIKDTDIPFYADAIIISRCLSNLINNSVEARSQNIEIFISKHNGTKIVIKDDGHGMSPEILSRAGTKGFSATKQSGMGLGLSYVRSEIEKLNGSLKLDSSLSNGTQITINLSSHN